jgi:hypothetical protein
MQLYGCYLRKGIVYLWTYGKVVGGPYRGIDPPAFIPVMQTAELRRKFQEVFARGNPIVPDILRQDYPPASESAELKYAGVKSWSAFNRTALSFGIEEREGIYRIIEHKKAPRGGFVVDPERTVTMPPGSSADDVIERMIATLQAAAGQ